MKKRIVFITLMAAGITVLAQDKRQAMLETARSGSGAEKQALGAELLEESADYKQEAAYSEAIMLFNIMGQNATADSLVQVTTKKFPKGEFARRAFIQKEINDQEELKSREKGYKALLKKWPIADFPGDEIVYDYVKASLARGYAEQGNMEKAIDYLESLQERFWRAQGYDPVAGILLSQGDTARAIPLIQTTIEDAEYFIRIPEEEKTNKARFAAVGYPGYVRRMAGIYENRGESEKALELVENALALAPEQADNFSKTYYKGLISAGRKLEALQQLERLYENGDFSYKPEIQELYAQLNGSEQGFQSYMQGMQAEAVKKIREHIKQMERNETAPEFTLLDMKGNEVALSDFRGKVVVLDFWATWCVPCKKSFPGMQAAQESYAGDDEVKFLFINTWERDKAYKENVQAFIRENQYPFHVLYDDQTDPETGKNLAAEFGVQGIPAKFIIDKQGNIRYALTGSSAIVDYVKLEMRELIESAKIPKS